VAKLTKYPLYIYDEPVTYSDFSGGINTDPSNEHLADNELRDCVNMHYSSAALIKRKGAKLLCNITAPEELFNVQGVFLYTYRITYIIIAADGKLYQGFYNNSESIVLKRLPILFTHDPNSLLRYNPDDQSAGLDTYYSDTQTMNHEGFTYSYTLDSNGNKETEFNYIGNWLDIINGVIEVGDIVSLNGSYYKSKNTFTETKVSLDSTDAEGNPIWLTIPDYNTYIQAGNTDLLAGQDLELLGLIYTEATNNYSVDPYKLNAIPIWSSELAGFTAGDIRRSNSTVYICVKDHVLSSILPTNAQYYDHIYLHKELIFQNHRKIEAATYNNVLYIATGTRFVNVRLISDALSASVVAPYICNNSEIVNIGYNYLSPYPEFCRTSTYNQAATTISAVLAIKNIYGMYKLTPQMTFAQGERASSYRFKWEKQINGEWYVIKTFAESRLETTEGQILVDNFTIDVTDADKYLYRCTFAKTFEKEEDNSYSTETIYRLAKDITGALIVTAVPDLIIDKVADAFFGSATSVLAEELDVESTYKVIHSCTKIHSDGNKFLLYGDSYNSGCWFKTCINNPNYITARGSLSFKTTKNESIIKVTAFNGNIIVFANSNDIGGSIHLVTGNGDDYDDQSGYYSPYRRSTINVTVSCDNADTVQVCENILIFKYYKTLYYISSSELSNDVVEVQSCNDRIKLDSPDVSIPWDDNTCVSEVTQDYYALLWKEQYAQEGDDLVLVHPGIRIKMYYKYGQTINNKVYYPWIRDESEYFNVSHILYIKGLPVYLFNNSLITFNEEVYTDLGNTYTCKVHFRGEDLNYPKMFKLLSNILVYYHRNPTSVLQMDLVCKNEANHKLLDSKNTDILAQDLKTALIGEILNNTTKLDTTILDSRVFTPKYNFPCLLANTVIEAQSDKQFSISSITYNYTTIDVPETNPYDLYTNIINAEDF